jgi:hypothetical protein
VSGDGLGVRVEESPLMGQWFESSLEQFLLKTKGVNSGLGNGNMIGYIAFSGLKKKIVLPTSTNHAT